MSSTLHRTLWRDLQIDNWRKYFLDKTVFSFVRYFGALFLRRLLKIKITEAVSARLAARGFYSNL